MSSITRFVFMLVALNFFLFFVLLISCIPYSYSNKYAYFGVNSFCVSSNFLIGLLVFVSKV